MHRDAATAALRTALHGRSDVHVAILFGSVARGRAAPDSDVDLAVVAPEVDLLALASELSLALGHDVDVVSLRSATLPLLAAVVRDGIPVHEGKRGAEATWRFNALLTIETDGPAYDRMTKS